MEKMNSRAIRVRKASRSGEIFEQGGVDSSVCENSNEQEHKERSPHSFLSINESKRTQDI